MEFSSFHCLNCQKLLVYTNTIDFPILILNSDILLNSLISYYFVDPLGFSTYNIISSENKKFYLLLIIFIYLISVSCSIALATTPEQCWIGVMKVDIQSCVEIIHSFPFCIRSSFFINAHHLRIFSSILICWSFLLWMCVRVY